MRTGERVLFLDVDGVLNNEGVFKDRRFGYMPLDHLCIERLHNVIRETGCKIVLSSAWREVERLEKALDANLVFEVYNGLGSDPLQVRHSDRSTRRLNGDAYNGRGSEIAEWLSRHPEVDGYAIVDDDGDMLPGQMSRFVQTTFDTGLADEHAARLIAILRAAEEKGR